MPPTLTTERLVLRPYREEDIPAAFELFECDPRVWHFDPGFARTLEQRAAILRRLITINEEDGEGTLAVTLKEDGRLIGQAGLQLYVLPARPFATPEVELYYKFGADFWGQGYAREACQALCDFAFQRMRLRRIVTVTQPGNQRSISLLLRLGMRMESGPAAWPDSVLGILDHPEETE